MPPPAGMAGAVSFLGASTMVASVVISRPAIEAASWIAVRTTLVGSMMPFLTMIDIFAGLGVEAISVVGGFHQLADHDRAIGAGVVDDLTRRRLDGLADDVHAGLLVAVGGHDAVERLDGAQQSDAAARQDAFFDRRAGGVQGVFDAVLLFLHFDFGRAADADDRDAARELGQSLLKLLAVIVRGGFLDLRLDLGDAGLDVLLLAIAVDNGGVFLVETDLLGATQHRRGRRFRA